MKSPLEITAMVKKQLAAQWHKDVVAEAGASATLPDSRGTASWPKSYSLRGLKGTALEAAFGSEQQLTFEWREFAAQKGLGIHHESRRVFTSPQQLASRVNVPSLAAAASLCGKEWVLRVNRARKRLVVLRNHFPKLLDTEVATVLRLTDTYSDVDFELLCIAGCWFQQNPDTGLTPRQVPIEGLHAKWLNTRLGLVRRIAGLESLGLAERHPQRAHFTYLDPEYRDEDQRLHDSASVGDAMRPAYEPSVVVIAENKDSALHFLPMPRGVSVEGEGSGAGALPHIDWIVNAPFVVYWGDLDVAGLEIVSQFRAAGLRIETILMDIPTFDRYSHFGAKTDVAGRPLAFKPARRDLSLTPSERALYDRLTDPAWSGPYRVEQERIPLTVAADAVRVLLEGRAGHING